MMMKFPLFLVCALALSAGAIQLEDFDDFDSLVFGDLEVSSSDFEDAMLQSTTLLTEGGSQESINKMLSLLDKLLSKLLAEKAGIEKAIADAQKELAAAKAAVKSLEQQLLEQRAKCQTLSDEYEKLTDRLAKLKAELAIAKAAHAKAIAEAKEIAELEKEIALIKEIIALVEDAENVGAGTEELQTAYSKLTTKLVQLSPGYQPVSIMDLDEGRKHAELTSVKKLLADMLDMLNKQIAGLNSAVSSALAEVQRLTKLVDEVSKALLALELKLQECKLELARLNKAIAIAKGKVAELERLLATNSKEWRAQLDMIAKEIALIKEIMAKVKQLKPSDSPSIKPDTKTVDTKSKTVETKDSQRCWHSIACPKGMTRYGDGSACKNGDGRCDLGVCAGSPNNNMPTCDTALDLKPVNANGDKCWNSYVCPKGMARYGDGSACSAGGASCDLGVCAGSPNNNRPTCSSAVTLTPKNKSGSKCWNSYPCPDGYARYGDGSACRKGSSTCDLGFCANAANKNMPRCTSV